MKVEFCSRRFDSSQQSFGVILVWLFMKGEAKPHSRDKIVSYYSKEKGGLLCVKGSYN